MKSPNASHLTFLMQIAQKSDLTQESPYTSGSSRKKSENFGHLGTSLSFDLNNKAFAFADFATQTAYHAAVSEVAVCYLYIFINKCIGMLKESEDLNQDKRFLANQNSDGFLNSHGYIDIIFLV
ncbi:hypothetical protein C2G38_2047788 [Gigaspora rosea]|uniref:Uncharacterized protein n=1 Tax=Gigaspora rosea TaxID=44941 RepID=A0A397UCY4_9GLOM|nr:hypothetical protein C2G38_2047788 [Gigaspora rosea]